ncbi:hypothetical protein BV898_11558 [Hypsibius exemplaris]|uniref:Uncharacterized protein n=1 Tax=Hypsibius exemplaris TaxID=2072580 RepID=A0A1W0WG82_HYPEX|nr:hypothetical protein BV898_11558 [Hypsibius exemplaris]
MGRIVALFLLTAAVAVCGSRYNIRPRVNSPCGAAVQSRPHILGSSREYFHVYFLSTCLYEDPNEPKALIKNSATKVKGVIRPVGRRATPPSGYPKTQSILMKTFASKFTGKTATIDTIKAVAKNTIVMAGGTAVTGDVASAIGLTQTNPGDQQNCIQCYVMPLENGTSELVEQPKESMLNVETASAAVIQNQADGTVNLVVVVFVTVGGACFTVFISLIVRVKCVANSCFRRR